MNMRFISAPAALLLLPLAAGCGGNGADVPAMASATACAADRACVSTVAGSGEPGDSDGQALAARFRYPHALAVDADGSLQVADYGGSGSVRTIGADGWVATVSGNSIAMPTPSDVAVDADGNRYVADPYNNRILKQTPDGRSLTLAGQGANAGGDLDGDASTARFSLPTGVVLDAAGGVLYVADMGNAKVRRIVLAR